MQEHLTQTSLFDDIPAKTTKCLRCKLNKPVEEFPATKHRRARTCEACRNLTEKACTKCKVVQPIDNFPWNTPSRKCPTYPKKYRGSVCNGCKKLMLKAWVKRVGKRRARQTGLNRMYGINAADFERMNATQGGACAICGDTVFPVDKRTGEPYGLAVDHDHATGKVRDLLCKCCNNGLGCFKDSPDRLHAAIAYLQRHSTNQLAP